MTTLPVLSGAFAVDDAERPSRQTVLVVRQGRPAVTARWVAAQRARLHDQRPVLDTGDADAERRLYAQFSRGFLLPGLTPTGMRLRTRFIDEEVLHALRAGVDQIVTLGAGYDGRALRFRQPGVRWFEVDHPATQPDKRARMRRAAPDLDHVAFVPADLLVDDVRERLANAGHNRSRASLFLCEGLFTYLPNDAVSTLCSRLSDIAAAGSGLVGSLLVVPAGRGGPLQAVVDALLATLGERRLGIFHPGDMEQTLQGAGWAVSRRAETRPGRLGGSHLLLLAARPAPE